MQITSDLGYFKPKLNPTKLRIPTYIKMKLNFKHEKDCEIKATQLCDGFCLCVVLLD